MGARRSMSDFLEQEYGDQEEGGGLPPPPPAPARQLREPEVRESEGPEVPALGDGARWEQMDRKDVLLWPEQVTGLDEMRRGLQRHKRRVRRKGDRGERITENTLIRAAVTVLLENRGAVIGAGEGEITESLRAALRAGGA